MTTKTTTNISPAEQKILDVLAARNTCFAGNSPGVAWGTQVRISYGAMRALEKHGSIARTSEGNYQQEGNAALIAAAPDLYRSLGELADWMEDRGLVPPCLSLARTVLEEAVTL
jgi:hypothetical protein